MPCGGAGKESPSHGFAVTAPFRQGGRGDGGTDCHNQFANWSRNDMFFARGCGLPQPVTSVTGFAMTGGQEVRQMTGGVRATRSAGQGRAGRCGHRPLRRGLQEVQQNGPSGKSAKRCQWQKKRGGFEEVPRLADTTVAGNRLARRWATAGPYEISSFGIFSGENFLRQGDSVISRLFSSGLPSTMGETKEGIA